MKSKFCHALLVIICYSSQLLSLEYGISAKNEGRHLISQFFVIGERCSGTNYLSALIRQNTQLAEKPIGHKHFPPWYELGPDFFSGDPRYYHFKNTDNFLFLIIFRNPYDWLRSFHLQPHHSDISFKNIPFSEFIRKEWHISLEYKLGNRHYDVNPQNGLPFQNVLALRNAKIKTMLEITNRATNVYCINYETVRDYPEQVLSEIALIYHLELNQSFSPILTYKGVKVDKEYNPKTYHPISQDDYRYINSQLDADLEERIGYQIPDPVTS